MAIKLSCVIPARNEFPNIVHTCYSILHCWEADGFDPKEIELIIVNNCSDDSKHPQRGTGGTTDYLTTRGIYWNRVLRFIYDPIAGNHSARNKGAEIARGEYLFFSDAHMAYRPGFFKSILKAVDESGGIVHGVIGWMGAYPPVDGGLGYQYSIKLGEEIKGTWAPYLVADRQCKTCNLTKMTDSQVKKVKGGYGEYVACVQCGNEVHHDRTWFYIAAQGHCSVAVKRKQFFEFGGYPKYHRTYGGGEFYLNLKWWMFGSSVAVEPNAVGYHLASGRGYSYNHDDYIHNIFNIAYALGMDDWLERAYINYCRRSNKKILDNMMEEANAEMEGDRKFISKKRKKTFNQIIVERPWDKGNDEKQGHHFSGLTIFHDTWLPLIKGTPAEALYPGKYQVELEKFIRENLSDYIYKR